MSQTDVVVVTVLHDGESKQLFLKQGANLLMALVEAGLPIDFFCTTGKCTTCRLRMDIPVGSAAPPSSTERYRLGEAAVAAGMRLSCQVYVTGPLTVYLDASAPARP
ncbi:MULTISPECIES: 2Fe-2S iron-sulfur cluster-binding protein [Bacillales]|jgi:ferredoxin|uniref:Ferredoxin n=1 Tax=Brevibacillus aydinogluensis TaxID=927786 RepID=A0AA48MB33_9BACL|nr:MULTISPECIES: 2Fe-2S iron-sulfur cluster-binding protein [Bacillales]REK63364.1 MAG: ferredoxin [Brevibacillus sp.]MBR8660136.1 (2Fe-2S)-binding protein [Brevibacillus sp. NL20B1]MDT3414218.1 ferredoxin [Brevibacillus aydinogluensis]NNV03685.1 (2Fe-2S)-binding protein [Brevibacillus sp. MCWH]UFJ59823.1 (2Fe-2S)-binding protein [Anoxybacillus sediminis]